ncbi:MAG: hypothetical protein VB144_10205 [Clostridia bacterium]|nr:hypothetical protein [Clostridia bacterium]
MHQLSLARIAFAVAAAWAAWWTLFGLVSGIGEGLGLVGTVMHTVPGLVFMAAAAVGWKWNIAGGVVLAAVGLGALSFFGYLPSRILEPAGLLIGLPPVVSGVMFIVAGRRVNRGS